MSIIERLVPNHADTRFAETSDAPRVTVLYCSAGSIAVASLSGFRNLGTLGDMNLDPVIAVARADLDQTKYGMHVRPSRLEAAARSLNNGPSEHAVIVFGKNYAFFAELYACVQRLPQKEYESLLVDLHTQS